MQYHPIQDTPQYLLTYPVRCQNNHYGIYDMAENFELNYGVLKSVMDKLDGSVVGDFTLRVPKTSHEVALGGMILNNCMGAHSGHKMKEMNANPEGYVRSSCFYLDIHVIRNGVFVGCIAAENIVNQKLVASCGYGLFVNRNNTGNQQMDELLVPFINQKLGMSLKVVKVPMDNQLIG